MVVVEGSKWPSSSEVKAVSSLKTLILLKVCDELARVDSVQSVFAREDHLMILQVLTHGESFLLVMSISTENCQSSFAEKSIVKNTS